MCHGGTGVDTTRFEVGGVDGGVVITAVIGPGGVLPAIMAYTGGIGTGMPKGGSGSIDTGGKEGIY